MSPLKQAQQYLKSRWISTILVFFYFSFMLGAQKSDSQETHTDKNVAL